MPVCIIQRFLTMSGLLSPHSMPEWMAVGGLVAVVGGEEGSVLNMQEGTKC